MITYEQEKAIVTAELAVKNNSTNFEDQIGFDDPRFKALIKH